MTEKEIKEIEECKELLKVTAEKLEKLAKTIENRDKKCSCKQEESCKKEVEDDERPSEEVLDFLKQFARGTHTRKDLFDDIFQYIIIGL